MMDLHHWIDGAFVPAAEGDWIPVTEPATGKTFARCAAGTASDIDRAVQAARSAFSTWSQTTTAERVSILERFAALIDDHCDELAVLESQDGGKPIARARSVEIPRVAENLRFFASALRHEHSDAFTSGPNVLHWTHRRPRGVAGCISPWNLPLYLLSWKVAPALAAGCTVVAKPSEVTPATATRFAELSGEAGFPPGVLNIVHGYGSEAGAALVQHREVPTISFTGGTTTGRDLAVSCAKQFKRTSLELGGKNPFVVFADADLDRAATEAARAAFSNTGQICLCGSRILVESSVLPQFQEKLLAATAAMRVGDPAEETTHIGSLVSEPHYLKVKQAIEAAPGTVLCGGGRPSGLPDRCRDGWFLEPTILTDLPESCALEEEEVFGPVASLRAFSDESEALRLANATPYGLAASIWTKDLDRAHRLVQRVEAGVIWINAWMVRDLRTPFGGAKQSGLGREGGIESVHFFQEPAGVTLRLGDPS